MKIAIIGYGRMGRMIESVATERGHEVVCRIDAADGSVFDTPAFTGADVAIEFTTPATAEANLMRCFSAGVPVVCGTTGWHDALPRVRELCLSGGGSLFTASNFSLGVNIFMALNRYLTRIIDGFGQYAPALEEHHHIHKLDHPSGTAITLADDLVAASSRIGGWAEPDGAMAPGMLPVSHVRRGEVAGIHTIHWESDADTITISHSAKSRRGFAEGAVAAAEWLVAHKAGCYTMADMLPFLRDDAPEASDIK